VRHAGGSVQTPAERTVLWSATVPTDPGELLPVTERGPGGPDPTPPALGEPPFCPSGQTAPITTRRAPPPLARLRPRPRERHRAGRGEEHRIAFTALRAIALARGLRLVADAEGWPIIPGHLGRIEYHDGSALAVYTDRPRLFSRLWALPGVRHWQVGESEARALFPVEVLPTVAAVIQARRRRAGRPLTSQQALTLRAGDVSERLRRLRNESDARGGGGVAGDAR
jgi:hypothetical protein